MSSLRKTLVTALVAVMVLASAGTALASVTVAGKAFTDIAGHTYEKELTMLRALRILMGDTGTTVVRPDSPITRAEFSIVVVRMLGRDSMAATMLTYQPAFKDATPNWAWGHVNVAVSLGIIKGFDDGTFRPSDPVSHVQALAMLVRATGHEPAVSGAWPLNYIMAGMDLDIAGQVQLHPDLPATRGEVAHFVYNALFIKMGKGLGDKYQVDTESILSKAGRVWTGKVTSFDATAKKITISSPVDLADSVYLWTYPGFSSLLNAQVRAVGDTAKKVVYVEPFAAANVVTGLLSKIEAGHIYLQGVATGYPLDSAAAYKLNGGSTTSASLASGDSITLTLENGKAVLVDAFRVNAPNLVVTAVKTTAPATITAGATVFNVGADTAITLNGAPVGSGSLQANDVVYIATRNATTLDAVNIEAIRQTAQGVVNAVRTMWTAPGVSHVEVDLRLPDGTIKPYRLDGPPTPATGSTVIYGLNKAGCARVAIAATVTTSYVKMIGFQAVSGLNPAVGTFDVAGSTVSYPVGSGAFDHSRLGHVGKLVVNASTGQATAFRSIAIDTSTLSKGRVYAVDVVSRTITVQVYGVSSWLQEYKVSTGQATAYAETSTGTIGAYTRPTDLAPGTLVWFKLAEPWSVVAELTTCVEEGDAGKVIFLLKKYDQSANW